LLCLGFCNTISFLTRGVNSQEGEVDTILAEDLVLVLIGIFWTTLGALPFVGLRVPPNRRALFERISDRYFKFTLVFTVGGFFFILGEERWRQILDFLINGNVWMLMVAVPVVFWLIAGYMMYRLWRELLYGLRGENPNV
jgi:hypothetical protein